MKAQKFIEFNYLVVFKCGQRFDVFVILVFYFYYYFFK